MYCGRRRITVQFSTYRLVSDQPILTSNIQHQPSAMSLYLSGVLHPNCLVLESCSPFQHTFDLEKNLQSDTLQFVPGVRINL